MKFEEVLAEIKAGEQARNTEWNGKDMYIQAFFPDIYNTGFMDQPFLIIRDAKGRYAPWFASQQDLFSEGWEIIR